MKSYKGIISSLTAATLLAGCANEAPFDNPAASGETGKLMTRCLSPKLTNSEGVNASTRAEVPSTDDFKVVISRKSNATRGSEPGSVEYTYSEMPEVLTLPVGDYQVYAHHGENAVAAWESPYYYGESEFGIETNKITDDVDPIVARLSNIRVTIVFHSSLLNAMSGDANKVEVKVGDEAKMTFTPEETRSAYFKYVDNSQTLAATFDGYVDGSHVILTHTEDNVAPGNHYRITFRVHGIEPDDPGTVDGNLTVNASVEKVDMNHTIDGEEQGVVENPEDWRPSQGGGEDPGPGPDEPTGSVPTAEALAPDPDGEFAGFDMIKLDLDPNDGIDVINEITDHLYCAWKVVSTAEGGFKVFDVDIISSTLTPGELSGVGLTDHLNLIDPGAYEEALASLGFPVNIGGMNEAEFDITGFLSLMTALGPGNHEFTLTVNDADGTSVISIKLHND